MYAPIFCYKQPCWARVGGAGLNYLFSTNPAESITDPLDACSLIDGLRV